MTALTPSTVVSGALLVTAGGLAAALVAWSATHKWQVALQVLLEFLTAAGLLRLVVATGYRAIASAALIIVIRHIVSFGLRARGEVARRPRSSRRPLVRPDLLDRVGHELRIALRPVHR